MSKLATVNSTTLKSEFGVDVTGANGDYIDRGVGTAAARLKALGKEDLMKGMKVEMFPGGKPFGSLCSSYTPSAKHIQVVAKCPRKDGTGKVVYRNDNATSIALNVLHEVGHATGQSQGFYGAYTKANPTACKVSSYCTHNTNSNPRNEEFAEVFAAFVHSPNTLKMACPGAYNFMAQNVFGKEGSKNICNGVPATSVAENIGVDNLFNAPQPATSGTGEYNLNTANQVGSLGMELTPALALAALQAYGGQYGDYNDTHGTPETVVIPRNPTAVQCNRNSPNCANR